MARERTSAAETPGQPGQRWGARWPSRVLMVVVPLHLVAFILLYAGMLRLVQGEILRTHRRDARLLLSEAVKDLHPFMVSHEQVEMRDRVASFVRAHRLLDLRLFTPEGVLIGDRRSARAEPAVERFLAASAEDRFEFVRSGGDLALHGMLRVVSEGACTECHPAGEMLAVASMRLDLTEQLSEAHRRLGRNLLLLLVGWAVLVGAVNLVLGRVAMRSVALLRRKLAEPEDQAAGADRNVSQLVLDPVAAELYQSLRLVLRRQHDRDVEVTSKMQHAERLASLGKLAAGLAHEIKNPLAGIRGVLELLRDDSSEGQRRELYTDMLAELDRVNGTIQALLSYARPARPELVPTDLAALIDSVAGLLRPGLERRGITLEVSTTPDLPTLPLDPAQIRQVLVNLVNNAADAIGSDGLIRIRATSFPARDGLILAVEDDGPGVPEDERDKLFEPFFTTKFSGTGLGLAIVRSLVSRHGGTVEVTSAVGEGTTFFVMLPGDRPAPGEES